MKSSIIKTIFLLAYLSFYCFLGLGGLKFYQGVVFSLLGIPSFIWAVWRGEVSRTVVLLVGGFGFLELLLFPFGSCPYFHLQFLCLFVAFWGHVALFNWLVRSGILKVEEVKTSFISLAVLEALWSIPYFLSYPEGGFSGGFYWHNPMGGLLLLVFPVFAEDLLLGGFLYVFLLATLSRGAIIIGTAYVLFKNVGRRLFLLGVVGLSLVLLFSSHFRNVIWNRIFELFAGGYTVQARLAFWKASWEMWLSKPLFGWGFGSYGDVYPSFQNSLDFYSVDPHSILMRVLAEGGILGVCFLAAFLWFCWKNVGSPWREGLFLLFLHSLIDFDYTFLGVLVPAAVFMGVGSSSSPYKNEGFSKITRLCALGSVIPGLLLLWGLSSPQTAFPQTVPPQWLMEKALQAEKRGEVSEALRLARVCVGVRDHYPYYWLTLAREEWLSGNREEALELAKRAVELDPWNRPELYYVLFQYLKKAGLSGCEVANAIRERFPVEDPKLLANYKVDWKDVPVCGMFGEILLSCGREKGNEEFVSLGSRLIDWQLKSG